MAYCLYVNRPNRSKSKQQQAQTSQSKTTAKWKTYDDPVQSILMYHAVHVMDPSKPQRQPYR
ncbi:MAG: hypothetical protein ACLS5G_04965 [Streptococcus sp.]